ncbi:hypothetical protein, partial [Acetobacter aceti]
MENEIFIGINMKDAVRKARANLGETALIVSERIVDNGVEVVARKDSLENASIEDGVQEVSEASNDSEKSNYSEDIQKISRISDVLRWHRVPDALIDVFSSANFEAMIARNIQFGSFSFSQAKRPLALVGTAGAGKSLSVA